MQDLYICILSLHFLGIGTNSLEKLWNVDVGKKKKTCCGLFLTAYLAGRAFGIHLIKVLRGTRVQLEYLNMNHLDNVSTRSKRRRISAARDECAHVSHKLLLGSSLSAQVDLE